MPFSAIREVELLHNANSKPNYKLVGEIKLPGHVHIGGIQFVIVGLQILIWLAIFRILEVHLRNNIAGRALAFVH